MNELSVAVVGAGIAGSAAAWQLMQAGCRVTVFDKSRGTGGRLASTRLASGISADLGAPHFEGIEKLLPQLSPALQNVILPWDVQRQNFEFTAPEQRTCHVALERSSLLTRTLIQGADFHAKQRVDVLWPDSLGVLLRDQNSDALGYFDAVIVAVPAPQAVRLLDVVPGFQRLAKSVSYRPAWVLELVLESCPDTLSEVNWIEGKHPLLSRVIRDSSKPGREGEVWTLHANPDWTQAHLEDEASDVTSALLQAFSELCYGDLPQVFASRAHRWRYAFCSPIQTDEVLWHRRHTIGVCGDWVEGGNVGGAFNSGLRLANKIIAEHMSPDHSETAAMHSGITKRSQDDFLRELETESKA